MKKLPGTIFKQFAAALCAAVLLSQIPAVSASAVTSNGAIAQGIDVSKHNGAVNWGQVAASGMKFTFIKVGSTNSGIDPNFASNITNAQAAGIKTGVYIYSYATTPEQAVNEANLVLQWINNYTVNFPVVFDIEDKCHLGKTPQELADIVNSFCSVIDAAGYYPMVYGSKNWFTQRIGSTGWDKWVAQYNTSCEYDNNVSFWQYTSTGKIGGVGGGVDINYQYKDFNPHIIQEGFLNRNGNTRFYSNWRMQKGWITYNDTRYYLDGAGNMIRGWYTDPAGTYYLSPQDGSIARGQSVVDGGNYYFTADGIKTVGWVALNDQKYYYEPVNNGILKREWFSDDKGNFYYFDKADGHMLTGGLVIDKVEYLFGADGIRQHGWVNLENGTFYYDPATGGKIRGFMEDAKGRRYLSPDDGHLVSGAATIDNKNYFFNPEGIMINGLLAREDGSYYYDPATGQMVSGWIQAGDKTYFADAAGHIVTGAYEIQKQMYYFDAAGILIRNQPVTLEEVNYNTNEQGILVKVEEAAAGANEQPAAAAVPQA